MEENGIPGLTLFGSLAYIPLDELIEDSEVIAIGEVGEIVATDYPLKYQTELPPEDDFEAQDEYVNSVYSNRLAFHEFHVSETLKGEHVDSFIFARDDVAYYEKIEISELEEGAKILLFARNAAMPDLLTNKVEHFYDTRGDNGIFDLDDQNRAYPRSPSVFRELTTEDGFYTENAPQANIEGDSQQPHFLGENLQAYFDLDKLKATISN